MPAAVNQLTAAGKAARRGKATIYRDLFTLADAFARCAKANSPAAENVSVVVEIRINEIPEIRAPLRYAMCFVHGQQTNPTTDHVRPKTESNTIRMVGNCY